MGDVRHSPYRVFEHVLSVLNDVMHFLLDGFRSRGIQASACGHVKKLTAGTVGLENEVDNSGLPGFRGLKEHSPCPIPEKDASRSVFRVHDRGHHIGADHDDLPMCPCRDELSARG